MEYFVLTPGRMRQKNEKKPQMFRNHSIKNLKGLENASS